MPQTSYNLNEDGITSDETQTRKPDNTAFKQQRLPAWQPILTPKSVFPTFILVGIIFVPIGSVLLTASNGVVESSYDYTDCKSNSSDARPCSELYNESCICLVNFTINKQMNGNIFVYYGLTNFFQNHRRYVKSRDDNQLNGERVNNNSISGDCVPYRLNHNGMPIAPCGAIANSLFNDTFTFLNDSVIVDRTNIAWKTDHEVKFQNPEPKNNLTVAFANYAKPLFWSRPVYELDLENNDNNGYKNEAFEVWMRTSAFPTFRKLYGRINVTLNPGTYPLTINYNYPVTAFDGTKRIILSTTSFMGGKNSFLGIAYIVVGSVSFLVGFALLIVHCATKKRNRAE